MPEKKNVGKIEPLQVKHYQKFACSVCGSSWLYRRKDGMILCRKCGNVNKPVVEGSK